MFNLFKYTIQFTLLAVTLYSADLNDLRYRIYSDEYAIITDCDEEAIGELVIPGSIDGYPVALDDDGANPAPARITNYGFVDENTFNIEFSPGGPGYRVLSAPDLDFSSAQEDRPNVQPVTKSDNRFEFDIQADRDKDFFRVDAK